MTCLLCMRNLSIEMRQIYFYLSYLFHEFGHWIVGEILANDMMYSLDYVWPKEGQYLDKSHNLYISIGGPALTILLAVVSLLILEKYSTIYAYPVLFFQFVLLFFLLSLEDSVNKMKLEYLPLWDSVHIQ